jgi:type VI secretion system protein ImpF
LSKQVRAPLFDRLIDRDPGVRREPRPLRTLDRRGLRESIRRELEHLFNTRSPLPADRLQGRDRTVVEYGVPDLAVLAPGREEDRQRLAAVLRQAIEAYEPRLAQVRVAVDTPPPDPTRGHTLRARIEATLVVEEVPESVSFGLALGAEGVEVTAEVTAS